jgi:hypothetical protein
MISSRIGRGFAALTILCTLLLFLCPAVHGSYSAVHGPVTAMQAARAALKIHAAIAYVMLNPLPKAPPALTVQSSLLIAAATPEPFNPSKIQTLRC